MAGSRSIVADVLVEDGEQVTGAWLASVRESYGNDVRVDPATLDKQARELIAHLQEALRSGGGTDVSGPSWDAARRSLEELSRNQVRQGFTSDQTATFGFSLKQPLFERLRVRAGNDASALADAVWEATQLVDSLGLYTVRAFQRTREDVIARQQNELLELSTPVVKLWDGVLALPMIGTLDSARTQIVMESLLRRIVETGSQIAIVDITGVPTVDTLVAQHLLKTVTAIRLMGAECIISGVRPQIAQTIVHLGIDLEGVQTKATLADALRSALRHIGVEMAAAAAAR